MRVLFVFPDLDPQTTHYTGMVSNAVAGLSAVLAREGHERRLLHLTAPPREDEFRASVRAARPDLVAFSSNSHYARRLRAWTAWAREASGAPVAVGGVHATLAPEEVSSLPAVDFTCVGEGEGAMAELCGALERGTDPSVIPNLWVRRGDAVVRNAPRPLVRDLDALPDPDFGIFDFARLHEPRQGIFPHLMSRGCPYRCTYCCVAALRAAGPGPRGFWRFHSPREAAECLARLIARHLPAARQITFADAIFFRDPEWLEEFAPLYRAHVGLPFGCTMRADRLDERSAAILAGMGCAYVRLGLESGDERISREVMKRSVGPEDLRRAFALLRAHGIARWSYNIVGIPGETLREALATVRLNAEVEPEAALPFLFHPYPGTELHRVCRERGLLGDRELDHYRVGVAARLPEFPAGDVLFVQRFFGSLVRLYALGRRLRPGARARWWSACDAVLAHPWLPRGALVGAHDAYRRVRHVIGEWLVRRSPRAYRLFGGRDRGLAPPLREQAG